jgi:hypothetical protein
MLNSNIKFMSTDDQFSYTMKIHQDVKIHPKRRVHASVVLFDASQHGTDGLSVYSSWIMLPLSTAIKQFTPFNMKRQVWRSLWPHFPYLSHQPDDNRVMVSSVGPIQRNGDNVDSKPEATGYIYASFTVMAMDRKVEYFTENLSASTVLITIGGAWASAALIIGVFFKEINSPPHRAGPKKKQYELRSFKNLDLKKLLSFGSLLHSLLKEACGDFTSDMDMPDDVDDIFGAVQLAREQVESVKNELLSFPGAGHLSSQASSLILQHMKEQIDGLGNNKKEQTSSLQKKTTCYPRMWCFARRSRYMHTCLMGVRVLLGCYYIYGFDV